MNAKRKRTMSQTSADWPNLGINRNSVTLSLPAQYCNASIDVSHLRAKFADWTGQHNESLKREKEFEEWCDSKDFIDNRTVTGDTLHLFLEERVIGRSSLKRKRTDSGSSRHGGRSTTFSYTAAIVVAWGDLSLFC